MYPYKLVIFKKTIFKVLYSHSVRMSTYINAEFSTWAFGISCAFTECYAWVTIRVTLNDTILYGNFASF